MSFEAALTREFNLNSDATQNFLEANTNDCGITSLELLTPIRGSAPDLSEPNNSAKNHNCDHHIPPQVTKSLKPKYRLKSPKSSHPPPHNQRSLDPSICSNSNSLTYQLVHQILCTVGELENTLIEDHEHDFNLRMALDRQTAKMKDLNHSLENEKERNVRLMELIRGVDSNSSTDEEADCAYSRCSSIDLWQARTSEAFESISPLLMQQRYDELSVSYKQCRRQLARKDKQLTLNRCQTEELRTRYDNLLDQYRNEQQRFEQLCCKYLQLQAKKNHEIQRLRDALNCASDCVLNAQQILDSLDEYALMECPHTNHNLTAFKQNLQLFVKTLRLCQWAQSSSHRRKNIHLNLN